MNRQLSIVLALGLLASAVPPPSAAATDEETVVPFLEWAVLSRRPHDDAAWTQGLELDSAGRLFESTGQYERSTLREVDPLSGAVLRARPLPDEHFGEGLTVAGDRLFQLTWLSGVATAWDPDTFESVASFEYAGQGWGLCYDGEQLVMSDGSATLTFRDPGTFEATGEVAVTLGGEPLSRINELECVAGHVWANVLGSDSIVRIDPDDGSIDGIVDLSGIIDPHPADAVSTHVLNGIAYDASSGTWLVTGKHWPELIEIRIAADQVTGGD